MKRNNDMTTLRHNDIWRRDFDISTSRYNDISIRKWRPANIAVAFLLASLLLAGCGSDSFDDEPQNVADNASPKEITIKTDITSMQTRATTIDDDEDLQGEDLRIDAYFHYRETKYLDGTKLHYDSSWKFWDGAAQLHYYWPIEGSVYNPASDNITVSSLDFVGYCPYTTPAYITTGPTYNHSSGISFTCDMSSYMTAASQASITEFMIAKADNRTSAGGAVPLTFKHPFACVKFQLSASHPDIKINVITLKSLKTGGTCSFNGSTSTWSSLTGSADFEATLNQTCNDNPASPVALGSNYIVIPQTFAGEIEVNASWNDWGDTPVPHTMSTTITSVTWQAGYSYTYTFTISTDDLVVNITNFTEQW